MNEKNGTAHEQTTMQMTATASTVVVLLLMAEAIAAAQPVRTNQAPASAPTTRAPSTLATAAQTASSSPLSRSSAPPAAASQTQERVYLIEIVDTVGEKSYQTVPLDRYYRLRNEASLRNRFQPKALALAKEEWKETYAGLSKAFPPNVADQESVTSLGLFTTEEAARAKLMELKSKAESRRASDGDKMTGVERQIKALREDIERLANSSVKDRDMKIQAERNALKILERDFADQLAKKAKQEEDLREARALFEKKLSSLVADAAK